jgi:hypothetical protein
MRTLIGLCLASLIATSVPAAASASGFPRYKVDAGISAKFNVYRYDPLMEAARLHPWYTYFPHEAHFQSPAPYGFYPHYPACMTPGAWHHPPPAAATGQQQENGKDQSAGPEAGPQPTGPNLGANAPAANHPANYPGFQPAGYYYGQVPSYWYGR